MNFNANWDFYSFLKVKKFTLCINCVKNVEKASNITVGCRRGTVALTVTAAAAAAAGRTLLIAEFLLPPPLGTPIGKPNLRY